MKDINVKDKKIRITLITHKQFVDASWIRQEVEILKSMNFDVTLVPLNGIMPSFRSLLDLIKYSRIIVGSHIVFGWFAYPTITLLGKIFRKVVVLNAVGSEVAWYPEFNYGLPSWWLARALISLGLRKADYVIAISKESGKWAIRWGAKKVAVIYEGIDTQKFKCDKKHIRKDHGEHKIVTVAYLSKMNVKRKNFINLLKAFKEVIRILPHTKLIIVGKKMDGYPVLLRMVRELGIKDSVIFTGQLRFGELLDILCNADAFVMPSLQEGFPTALCEALSCGIPIITSNRPSMYEIFINGKHALMVDAYDYNDLAKAIIHVLTNRDYANLLASEGKKLVENKFSKRIRAMKLMRYLNRVITESKHKVGKKGSVNLIWLILFIVLSVLSSILITSYNAIRRTDI